MTKKQKLELTWVGKEKRPRRREPSILLEDRDLFYPIFAPFTSCGVMDGGKA